MSEPTTEAGRHTHATVRSSHTHLGYPSHDHSWVTLEDAVAGGYGQAAEARASQPLTLDVERLAQALYRSQHERLHGGYEGGGLGTHEADAAAIAAEYERLSRCCVECGEPWPCAATVTGRKDGIPHRLPLTETAP